LHYPGRAKNILLQYRGPPAEKFTLRKPVELCGKRAGA